MRKSLFSENKIYWILLQANGQQKISDICRQHGISISTFYRWKAKYCSKKIPDKNQFVTLQEENTELKIICANLYLENKILKDSLSNSTFRQ